MAICFNMKLLLLFGSLLLLSVAQAQPDLPEALAREINSICRPSAYSITELGAGGQVDTQGSFLLIVCNAQNPERQYAYSGRVNSCRAGGCSSGGVDGGADAFEYFDYFIIFDASISVLNVKVFNYQASHGQEITARGWLKQFRGYDGSRLMEVGKQIDAISGATISVNAITDDIKLRTKQLKALLMDQAMSKSASLAY